MALERLLVFAVLEFSACAVREPSHVRRTEVEPDSSRSGRVSCDEQVEDVRPTPTGASREQYVWGCLLEHEFAAYLWERQGCSADNECTTVETGCPFGCGAAVATRYAVKVSAEYERLAAKFNERADCKYKCNPVVGAYCAEQRCQARHLIERR